MSARLSRLVLSLFTPSRLPYVIPGALLILLCGGLLFAAVDHVSAWDGIWWLASTVTTVGYGDITPQTTGGRIIAIAVMVFGIGFLFLMTGAIVERFISREVLRDVSDVVGPDREILRQLHRMEERMVRMEAELQELRRHPGRHPG